MTSMTAMAMMLKEKEKNDGNRSHHRSRCAAAITQSSLLTARRTERTATAFAT